MTPPDTYPLATAVCCRAWPVTPLAPIGRCKFCGERPVVSHHHWANGLPVVKVRIQPAVRPARCGQCADLIEWQDCPTGGWWIHHEHPDDGHDAYPEEVAS